MEQGQRRQARCLIFALLLISFIVSCGNSDSATEVTFPQGVEQRNLAASEKPSTTQVTLRITGMS